MRTSRRQFLHHVAGATVASVGAIGPASRTHGEARLLGGMAFHWCPPGRFLMGSPPAETNHRRGGAWIEPEWACRSACRLRYEPHRSSDHIGFRVVAVVG